MESSGFSTASAMERDHELKDAAETGCGLILETTAEIEGDRTRQEKSRDERSAAIGSLVL
jgi:hypothetical protein